MAQLMVGVFTAQYSSSFNLCHILKAKFIKPLISHQKRARNDQKPAFFNRFQA